MDNSSNKKMSFYFCKIRNEVVYDNEDWRDTQRPPLYDSELISGYATLERDARQALKEAELDLTSDPEDVRMLREEHEVYVKFLSDAYFDLLKDLPFKYDQ